MATLGRRAESFVDCTVMRNLRRQRGLGHKDMAKLLGLKTTSAYWKKENGFVPISLREAKIISDFFGKRIEEIFFKKKVS